MQQEGEIRVNRLDPSRKAVFSNGQWYEVMAGKPAAGAPKGSYLPQQLQIKENVERDLINSAGQMNSTLDRNMQRIGKGELNLGPVSNAISTARNFVGLSNPRTRNYASFRSDMERIRNDSLRLNKGVQTEGDAQRAWNEMFANLNDEGVVAQRMAEIEQINNRAVEARLKVINQQRIDRGLYPLTRDQISFPGQQQSAPAAAPQPQNALAPRAPQPAPQQRVQPRPAPKAAPSGGRNVIRFDAQGNIIQ